MEMGAHSLRSGADMAIFLVGVTSLTIVIIEKWRSDAFLMYIKEKVAQFSTKILDKMQKKRFIHCPGL